MSNIISKVGKPLGTKNDYNKKYVWIVEKNDIITEYNTIDEISKSLNFSTSKVKRLILKINKRRNTNINIYKKYINVNQEV